MKRVLSILILATLTLTTYGAESNDPLTFTSGNTTFKFGGFINLTIGKYLDGATTTGKDFPSSAISMTPSADDLNRLQFDPSSTRLSFQLIQSTQSVGDIKLYVETDFRGTSNTLVLRIATAELMGFTIGQTWSNMTDLAATAPTVDLPGANSRTFFRTPQIAYRHNISECFTLGAAIESPVYNLADATTPEISTPDFILLAQTKGKIGHLKAAAVWRTIPYLYNDNVEHQNGWGVQLSGSLKAAKPLTLYSQAIYGQNISKYINDLSLLSYDLLETTNSAKRLSAPMYGASVGAKGVITEKWSVATNISKAQIDIDESYAGNIDDTYKIATYLSVATFYYPIKKLMLGLEYLNGTRKNYDGSKGDAQRMNLIFRYSF
ncbi:MAG: porin [Rikenellaceae bacterium]